MHWSTAIDRRASRGRGAGSGSALGVAVAAALLAAGCKTDLNQQLLERELRMQEDQIYRLQDELRAKAARLEIAVGENSSLRRQLGIADPSPSVRTVVPPSVTVPSRPSASSPTFVPPPRIPDSSSGGGAAPGGLRFSPAPSTPATPSPLPAPGAVPIAPPSLDGVPPLPGTSARAPAARRLSFEESLAGEGRITHLVVNPDRTACFDGDGDGVTEGFAIVVEPRDADERLVTAAGDMVVFVNDPAVPAGSGPTGPAYVPAAPTDPGEGACIARFEIPEAEASAHFRRTSRARGIHLVLRWPGPPPRGESVVVHVVMTTFDGSVHRIDAPVAVRPAAPGG